MTSYLQIKAYNVFDNIKIKELRHILPGQILGSTTREMVISFPDGALVFIFQFGCVVFFNFDAERAEAYLDTLKKANVSLLERPTYEQYAVKLGEQMRVEFDFVELTEISIEQIRFVAMTIGQSAALEFFEVIADDLLNDSSSLMKNLAAGRRLPWNDKKILKTIGTSATARQRIISNVWVLDPPEDTWKSAELEFLFKELQQNFDIDMRFKTLEKKLTIVQDNNEILADLVTSRKTAFLELLIVLLIVLEIVMALFSG